MSETYFDTSIVVDTLAGHHLAMAELRRVSRPWISRATWLEVMAEVPPALREETEAFLANFAMREISAEIARRAAALRFERPGMALGAALVLASAQEHGGILVTRNIKDFPAEMPGIRVPYK